VMKSTKIAGCTFPEQSRLPVRVPAVENLLPRQFALHGHYRLPRVPLNVIFAKRRSMRLHENLILSHYDLVMENGKYTKVAQDEPHIRRSDELVQCLEIRTEKNPLCEMRLNVADLRLIDTEFSFE
jgi:hypothetical protein